MVTGTQREQRIGPYLVRGILGSGGMGIVYRAVAADGSEVALKVLHHQSEDLLSRFDRESRIRIEHPNVVQIVAASTDQRPAWIAFEVLEGQSLDRELMRGPLEAEAVRALGIQTCAGLAAAHASGVVHRDLKPANIFRTTGGTIKILDFGIAKWSADASLTSTDLIMGSPEYLAPEQARGSDAIDPRTDIWGLGAVLYHALTGQPPFRRESALATLAAVLMEPVRPVIDVAPWAPPALASVVQRALSKAKERRHGSAIELGEALRALDDQTPSALEPPMLADEWRVVAVMLADGLRDRARFEEQVRARGGRPIALVGARALALFGGEQWTGEEIEQCALAALACRDAAAHVAIGSGRAARARDRLIGGVISSVEQCAREDLEGVAVDAEAARALADAMPLVEVRPGLFELEGRGRAKRRTAITVGRELELSALEREAARAIEQSSPQVVLVTGAPGIGKSRLVDDLAQRLHRSGYVLRARGRPHLAGNAYALATGMLEAFAEEAQAVEGGSPLTAREAPMDERQHALYRLVAEALDVEAQPACAEFLGALLGIELPATATAIAARQDLQLMEDRIRLALLDWFEGLAHRSPLVLIAEDLQWADEHSLALFAELVERLAGRPLFLLATARSDSSGLPVNVRIELAGLLAADVARLGALINGAPLEDRLARALADQTGGNPLFVEQLVRAMVERGDADLGSVPIPLTVEAAIQARLDVLPAAEKEALKRASLFERAFLAAEVEALEVDAGVLQSLVRRGILGRGRDHRYSFRSAMVGAVAQRMLSDRARAEVHAMVAAVLERTSRDAPEEIARHHQRAGSSAAAQWYAGAALAHAQRADSHGVVRCAELALSLGDDTQSFELQLAYAEALQFLGRDQEHELALAAALAAAQDLGSRANVLAEQVKSSWRRGRAEEALELAARAEDLAARAGDARVRALVLGRQGLVLANRGQPEKAQASLREASRITADAPPHLRGMVAGMEAQLATQLGDQDARRAAFRLAGELYAEAGDLRRAAAARVNLADVSNRMGAFAEAEHALREALEDCRRVGNRPMQGYALANLGYAVEMQGRAREAVEILEEAQRISMTIADSRLAASVAVYLAKARLAIEPSVEIARAAEATAREAEHAGQLGRAVFAMTIAARAHLALGAIEAAMTWSERALALRDRLGSVEEDEADVFLARAAALDATGRSDEARLVRERGRQRVVELADAMSDWDQRSRFLTDVPSHRKLWEGGEP